MADIAPLPLAVVFDDGRQHGTPERAGPRARRPVTAESMLLAAVAHDLYPALGAITGLSGLLADPGVGGDDRARALADIRAASDVMIGQCRDLAEVARLLRTGEPPRGDRADVAVLVRDALAGTDVGGRRVLTDLPSFEVTLSGPTVQRIVANLLLDAAGHTRAGTTIRVWARPRRPGMLLGVEDDDPARRAVVAPPGAASADPTGPEHPGLAALLAGQFVRAHGGEMRQVARHGGGTSVEVLLTELVAA
ncbi:sensor histidine kinase [Pseudonocardia acidicola]|uniref:histidine kinase n=1 Tax=Pseudonocardia acidicola TaxID=2724939 RepID=A0ABX1SJA3_9PSEU|nr:hypothetical protein [Pseudonocardia acidicola]NMI00325.1 hypothetical protein [Pseudonocardia acidicola]